MRITDRAIEVLTELPTFRLRTASTMARWWEGNKVTHPVGR